MSGFVSDCRYAGQIQLPAFSGTRVMMLPVVLGDAASIPDFLSHWKPALTRLWELTAAPLLGMVGYLTIDEKRVKSGTTHRRAGKHVDGVYRGGAGCWGGGGWGSPEHGMLVASNPAGCRAWVGRFYGETGDNGECEHLSEQCERLPEVVFKSNEVWHVGGMCVHESIPQVADVDRQFVRLSMPSSAPWFEGYTVNPKGVLPTGPILPRRRFMDEG